MKNKKWTVGILVTVFTTGLAGITISQTKARQDPDAPQYWLMQSPRSSWPSPGEWENMTSEQREQAMRKAMESRLREGLTRAGFTSDDLQDAIVNFSRLVETDRRSIREKGGKLRGAVADGSSDAQIAALMADLRRTVSAAKARRDKGRKDLNARTGFSKKPRLDAVLSLSGLGGDESSYLMSGFGGRGFGGRDSRR